MSLLDSAEAQKLLADADVSEADVLACAGVLHGFLERYLPCFYRKEQHELADVVVRGKLSDLQRKTSKPIAYRADRERKPVQHFVGAGIPSLQGNYRDSEESGLVATRRGKSVAEYRSPCSPLTSTSPRHSGQRILPRDLRAQAIISANVSPSAKANQGASSVMSDITSEAVV